MKILALILLFTTLSLYAHKNWIPLQTTDKLHTPKATTKVDINLSKIAPLNKIMKNATLLQQLLNMKTQKKENDYSDKE